MKKYYTYPIYAMSLFKNEAKTKIEGQANVIHEHTAKLVLYSDIRNYDINGWKKSIARAFNGISKITIKPKGKKLNLNEYMFIVLSTFGEDNIDIECFLEFWRSKLISELNHNPYPDIEITMDMVIKCNKYLNLYIQFCEDISKSNSQIEYLFFKNQLDSI